MNVRERVLRSLRRFEFPIHRPTVTTLTKLAKALDVEVREFFMVPERGPRDRAIAMLQTAKPDVVPRALQLLSDEVEKS